MLFIAKGELQGLALFGEDFEGVGHVFGFLGLDVGGMGADAAEAKHGIGHFTDVVALDPGLWRLLIGEGGEEGVELFLIFAGEKLDAGEEVVAAGVLGGAALPSLGGWPLPCFPFSREAFCCASVRV